MRTRAGTILSFVALGLALGLTAPAALADKIVLLVDERGNKIYINTGDPAIGPNGSSVHGFSSTRNASATAPASEFHTLVERTANQHEVDPKLVHAIIQVESDYNPKAVSRRGAMGLMQLIPSTATRFGVQNPFDPKQNIEGGVTYLRYLLDLFGGDLGLSLAAYNAGERTVLQSGKIPSFAETRDYVRRVTSVYRSGPFSRAAKPGPEKPAKDPIYRYIDDQGVMHFSNVD